MDRRRRRLHERFTIELSIAALLPLDLSRRTSHQFI